MLCLEYFLPEKALIVNLLALINILPLSLSAGRTHILFRSGSVSLHPVPTGQCCSGGFSTWVRLYWVFAPLCYRASSEGLAKAQLLFLLSHKPPFGTWRCRWHHLRAGQSPWALPPCRRTDDASGWQWVIFNVFLLLQWVMAAVLNGIVTSKRNWQERCKNMAKHLLK